MGCVGSPRSPWSLITSSHAGRSRIFIRTLYQHGDAIAEWLPLQIAGRFGVYLFFLISGFVIMMTLERATGVLDFTARARRVSGRPCWSARPCRP